MNMRLIAVVASCAVASGSLPSTASAATRSEVLYANPAQSCQLSIPTTDTKVRPRATSYNNEGTTSAFVICGYTSPAASSGDLTRITLGVRSLNGVANSITCTGVTEVSGYGDQVYVSKTLAVPATGYFYLQWFPADFGGTTGIPGSYNFSVTCNLPSNVGFNFTGSDYKIEIGT